MNSNNCNDRDGGSCAIATMPVKTNTSLTIMTDGYHRAKLPLCSPDLKFQAELPPLKSSSFHQKTNSLGTSSHHSSKTNATMPRRSRDAANDDWSISRSTITRAELPPPTITTKVSRRPKLKKSRWDDEQSTKDFPHCSRTSSNNSSNSSSRAPRSQRQRRAISSICFQQNTTTSNPEDNSYYNNNSTRSSSSRTSTTTTTSYSLVVEFCDEEDLTDDDDYCTMAHERSDDESIGSSVKEGSFC